MTNHSLSQPADVHWILQTPAPNTITRGDQRSFGELNKALRFVMEELEPNMRQTAWIATDGPAINLQEIEALYRTLPAFG
ncbi:MAG: hypothetical protein WAW96_14705 [Alphaproteobacteria bacterium]